MCCCRTLWPSPLPTWDLFSAEPSVLPLCFLCLSHVFSHSFFLYLCLSLPSVFSEDFLLSSSFLPSSSVFSKGLFYPLLLDHLFFSLTLSFPIYYLNINNGACCCCCQPDAAVVAALLGCILLICCFLSYKSHQLLLKPSASSHVPTFALCFCTKWHPLLITLPVALCFLFTPFFL